MLLPNAEEAAHVDQEELEVLIEMALVGAVEGEWRARGSEACEGRHQAIVVRCVLRQQLVHQLAVPLLSHK